MELLFSESVKFICIGITSPTNASVIESEIASLGLISENEL